MNRTSSPSMTFTRTGAGLICASGTPPASGLELPWALGNPKKNSARRKSLQKVGLKEFTAWRQQHGCSCLRPGFTTHVNSSAEYSEEPNWPRKGPSESSPIEESRCIHRAAESSKTGEKGMSEDADMREPTRRQVLAGGTAALLLGSIQPGVFAAQSKRGESRSINSGELQMDTITTKDGVK